MARTDNDSWDITEGVGTTALGVAMARAQEADRPYPLFLDPFAQLFLDAAVERGWQLPPVALAERIRAISNYAASRTKWFDDYFTTAGAHGIRQAVILAAGLDARTWRLPWIGDTVVYEIDQPQVLQFKADVLRSHDLQPAATYVPVAVDLRHDWPKALREAGFDPSAPTAWSAEGLLPYLPAAGQDLLFERVVALSAQDSRIAVEDFGVGFFDPEYLASRRETMRRMREEAGLAQDDAPDVQELWYIEDRTDIPHWLTEHCWDVTSITAADLMDRYGRGNPAGADIATPRTAFVTAELR